MSPRGTPEPIVARMRQVMADALKAPDVSEKLRAGDQIVVANTPAEAAAMLAAEGRKWGEVVRRIQLGLD
jgi:tripartite-type tricarboxylate transporter receptor subunit TctC